MRLRGVNPITLVFVDVVCGAAAQTDDQPAAAERVQQRDLLGEADRMMQRDLRHGEANPDLSGACGDRGRERHTVDVGTVAVEVVLGQPDRIEAEPVRRLRLIERLPDDGTILLRVAALGEQEVAESYDNPAGSRPEWNQLMKPLMS